MKSSRFKSQIVLLHLKSILKSDNDYGDSDGDTTVVDLVKYFPILAQSQFTARKLCGKKNAETIQLGIEVDWMNRFQEETD